MDSKFTIGAVCFMIIWLALIRKSQGAVINVIKYGAAYQKKKKKYMEQRLMASQMIGR